MKLIYKAYWRGRDAAKVITGWFWKRYGFELCGKILYGANWAYNMKLPGEALKLAAGFGGGMGVESSCGVITGGVMVLSSLYVSRNGHESGRIKALEKEFIETFTKEMGTIDCSDLKAKYRNDEIKCNLVIFKAGEILDRIVEREGLN